MRGPCDTDVRAREVTSSHESVILFETLQSERRPIVVDCDLAYRVQAVVRHEGVNDVTAEIRSEWGGELGVGYP